MKAPCKECPFRRESAPGWLGAHESSTEIVGLVNADRAFPCHLAVNALVEDGTEFSDAVQEAHHCVGALAFMNNSCKLSRNPEIKAQQREVGRRPDCFAFPHELVQHHGR